MLANETGPGLLRKGLFVQVLMEVRQKITAEWNTHNFVKHYSRSLIRGHYAFPSTGFLPCMRFQ